MTAARLSKETGVSESTVVRFATELGYEGYPEMQDALQGMLKNRLTPVQRINLAAERIGDDILGATLRADIANLKATLAQTDRDNFAAIVDMLFVCQNHLYRRQPLVHLAGKLHVFLFLHHLR